MSPHAQQAIIAAKHRHQWGRYATTQFLQRRGVPFSLYRLARQLEVSGL